MFTLYRMRDERNALEKLTSFVSSVLIFSFVPLMHVHANLSTFYHTAKVLSILTCTHDLTKTCISIFSLVLCDISRFVCNLVKLWWCNQRLQ